MLYDVIETALRVQFPFNMIIILGALGIGLSAITVMAVETRKFLCHRFDTDLKRDMIARGMSADEIERVLRAGPQPD